MEMVHEKDPRAVAWDSMGDIEGVELFANQVLVRIYERPEKTKGGVIITQTSRDEDKNQGKVGLVVKMGEYAFATAPGDVDKWFGSINAENDETTIHLGDWVYFRASDGWAIQINKQACRILDDVRVRGRVDHPDRIW